MKILKNMAVSVAMITAVLTYTSRRLENVPDEF